MCNCRDQNTNKNMKLQIWSFEKWNFKYRVSLLKTSNEVLFWRAKNFIFEVIVSFGDVLSYYERETYKMLIYSNMLGETAWEQFKEKEKMVKSNVS